MTSGGPWNLRGLRPETVEAARDAARQSGMSVGEWLNDVIHERDYRRAVVHADYGDDGAPGWPSQQGARERYRRNGRRPLHGDEFGEIHDRLDILTEQLERLAWGSAPLRGAPMQPPSRNRRQSRQDSGNPGLDDAFDCGDGEDPREPDAPSLAPAPHGAMESSASASPPEFPELEEQLRRITAQIEALRPSKELDQVIDGFRGDLAEIRRQLTEALPRQAVESLCAEVESLAWRIDRSRQLTADPDAIAGIERGLAEVRDALRGMTTAENLVGFDDALKALAQKLDQIVARKDPAALEQLETAIGVLRGVVSHVASNDALNKVADDVHGLATKIDALAKGAATGHAVSALGSRIDTLADALNASTEAGHAVPRELEKLLSSLIEKLDWIRNTAADPSAFKRLEDRITQLMGRLDASDARLGNLAGIERGLTEVLARIDELRGGGSTSPAGAQSVPAVEAIVRDVAEIKRGERRTQDSLEAVHDTVEQVVGRLAMIESDIHDAGFHGSGLRAPRSQASNQATSEPVATAPASASHAAATGNGTTPAAAASASHAAATGNGTTPAAAANGAAAPAAAIEPADTQDFIAAARRAVQAATVAPADDERRSRSRRRRRSQSGAAAEMEENKPSRLRKVLVAAGIVVATAGCLQIALHIFQDKFQDTRPGLQNTRAEASMGHPTPPPTVPATSSSAAPPLSNATAAPPAKPEAASPARPSAPAIPPTAAGASEAGPANKPSNLQNSASQAPAAPPSPAPPIPAPMAAPPSPPAPAAPGQDSALPNAPDRTSSLPGGAATVSTAPLPPLPTATTNSASANAPELPADSLPPTIGGPVLRAAAIAGDMAAQFEIGVRFAEGHGVAPNPREAARWLEFAARQGLAPAQFRLGGYYEKGIGVKKDLAAARDLYLSAAAKGNGKAMHNLAVLYAQGINGRSDYHSAALWFRKAADRGITDSQFNLAILYSRGTGTPQDYAEAYKWFALAAKEGDAEAAARRDEIGLELDEATLAAADLVVKNWRPEPQPDAAIRVKAPPGGWDATAKPKPRLTSTKFAGPDSKLPGPVSKTN
jgi:localization factor PodJL